MTNSEPMQCGWIDEFGNVFPKAAYRPEKKHWGDAHKALWLPVYTHPAPSSDCGEYGHGQGACGNASCLHPAEAKTNLNETLPFKERAMQRLRDVDDAARYRWLRSSLSVGEWNRLGHYGDDELDQKIDLAMKESK